MNEGLAAVQSRIAQLQSLLGVQGGGVLGAGSSTSGSGSTSSTGGDFAGVLADALGTSTGTGTGTSAAGARAVALAQSYDGVPYLWGGTDPTKGLDCSGLTQLVYSKLGVNLPRVAADQARAGTEVASLAGAQPGDLLFFGSPAHHVGIYAGDGTMVDAPHRGSTVGVHKISGYGPVSSIRRVAPAGTAAGLQVSGMSTSGLAMAGLSTAGLSTAELLSAGLPAGALAALTSASATTGVGTTGVGTTGVGTTGVGTTGVGTTTGAGGLTGPYAALFTAAGRKHGVDPALLSAVAEAESGYDAAAVSPAGARGLMQLTPGTARSLGVDPSDPAESVDGAARLLSGLMKQFGGRVDLALAGYNAGAGAVQRYDGVPPYSETRTYVQRVTSNWEALR